MNRRVDVAVAFCVALLGLFVLVSAQNIRPASVPDPIGSRGAPYFVGAVLLVGGLVLAFRRILRWRSEGDLVASEGVDDDPGVAPGSAVRAFSIWGACMVYVFAMPFLGYLIATPLFIAAVLWSFSIRSWMLVGVPIGATLATAIVFVSFLHVRLPTGLLDGVLRQIGFI